MLLLGTSPESGDLRLTLLSSLTTLIPFDCIEGRTMNVKEKVAARIDDLEKYLLNGEHLKSAEGVVTVLGLIASIAKFSSVLSEAERDLLNAAKMAVADRQPWM